MHMSPPTMDILTFSLLLVLAILSASPLALLAQSTRPISSRITVVGAVYCDTCFNDGFSRYSYFMPGADVHIQCKINANAPKTAEVITFSVNRTTDNNGVYNLEIPSVDGVDCVDGPPIQSMCQATLIGSSLSECNLPGLKATTDEISVKSKQDYLCVYSFTPLSFRPHKRNRTLCGRQAQKSSESESESESESSSSSKLSLPLPFPFSTPPPSLPFPFPHLPTSPSVPPLLPSPPPPSFGLGDPKTWIPHIPLMSPPPSPPPPAVDLRDPRTWRPLFPPSPPANPQKQSP